MNLGDEHDYNSMQPTALFLADILEDGGKPADIAEKAAAAKLRRLHAECEHHKAWVAHITAENKSLEAQRDALLEALKTVEWHGQGSCWVVDADKIAAAIKAAEENT